MVVLSWVVSRLLAANAALVPFSTFPKSLFGKVLVMNRCSISWGGCPQLVGWFKATADSVLLIIWEDYGEWFW